MILTPSDIGMPSQFSAWRAGQDDAIDQMIDGFQQSDTVVLCQPVGSGKTANYIALALLMGWRTLVITSTKALQDQLLRDFSSIGMVDIRGRANYQCQLGATVNCDEGAELKCAYQGGEECPYRRANNLALKSQLVTTNYTYAMLVYLYGEGLGRFDLVVMDEAHDAPPEVCSVMGQTITARQVEWMLRSRWPADPMNPEEWRQWARTMYPKAVNALSVLEESIKDEGYVAHSVAKEIKRWKDLVKTLSVLIEAEGPWAAEQAFQPNGSLAYRVEPLWAAQYARRVLFRDFPRVLLVSATVRRETMRLLGLEPERYVFIETPWMFPIGRSPVYYIPTAVNQKDSTDEEMGLIQQRIDEIMNPRQDRNGIVQAVSYERRDWLMARCIFNHTFITHERNSQATREAIARFEALQFTPPAVLVSPAIATGNDFKYRIAEYQIILKVPFVVVKGSPIMQARVHKRKGGDPAYADYLMAQTLSQMFGRIMRAPDDQGETFVIDSNFGWVMGQKYRRFFPPWVRLLVRTMSRVPAPPPPLASEGR